MRVFKIFNPRNWSRIESRNDEFHLESRANILLSQVAVFGVLSALIQSTLDFSRGMNVIASVELSMAIILILIYRLNETGRTQIAKVSFIIIATGILLLISNVVPAETGTFILFFPVLGTSFILFHRSSTLRLIYGFSTLSLVLLSAYYNFQIFGPINLDPSDPSFSFTLNIFISIGAFSIVINFLIKSNNQSLVILGKSAESEKRLSQKLQEKSTVLEKANAELDRFVYSTGHDLRAPLMSIRGLINLVRLEDPNQQIHEYLTMMEDRIGKLDNFINDIIFHSRNQRMEVVNETFSLKDLIDETVQSHNYAENAQLIEFNTDELEISEIYSDKYRLQVILNNLTNNAIKYHNLRQKAPQITYRSTRKNGHYEISVSDNGSGISTENLEKVFGMFVRATEETQGSGLGLYIVKETVDKLNGEINLISEEGKGSTFTLKLPAKA